MRGCWGLMLRICVNDGTLCVTREIHPDAGEYRLNLKTVDPSGMKFMVWLLHTPDHFLSVSRMGHRADYERLVVWQMAARWAAKILSLMLDERKPGRYRIIEQLGAAVVSVAANIAEGKGRYSKKEFVHFLYIARGSLYESLTLLEIFHMNSWLDDEIFYDLKNDGLHIARKINKLIAVIKNS